MTNTKVRVTFDPPAEVLNTYVVGEVGQPQPDVAPTVEVVQRKDAEVLLYCWDRPCPTSDRRT